MKQGIFSGCGTALVTPFLMDGSVDWDSLDRLVEDQLAGGVSCLVAAGTTGEPATMTREERMAVIRRVVQKAAGRVPVIAGTGGNNTREVIEEVRLARECGADAQLCVTPYYNKTTQAGHCGRRRPAGGGLQRALPHGHEYCSCDPASDLPP